MMHDKLLQSCCMVHPCCSTVMLQYLQSGYCTNYGKGPWHVLLSWRNNICWSCPYPFLLAYLSCDHMLTSDWSVRCRVSTPCSLTFSGHTPSAHARCLPTLWLKCSIILCTFCSNMTLWNFLTQIRCNLIQIGHAATDISKFVYLVYKHLITHKISGIFVSNFYFSKTTGWVEKFICFRKLGLQL